MDVSKVFGYLYHSGVPLFRPLVILSGVPCLIVLIRGSGSVNMIIPVYYCKLPPCLVHLIPSQITIE